MDNKKKGNTANLEVLVLLLSLIVIACVAAAFLKQEMAYLLLMIMTAAGACLNLSIAVLKFKRGGKKQGICFILMTVLLLGAFVVLYMYK